MSASPRTPARLRPECFGAGRRISRRDWRRARQRSRPQRPALGTSRSAVALAAGRGLRRLLHGDPRRDGGQRRPAGAVTRPAHHHHGPSVGGGRLQPGVRGAAAFGRGGRGPPGRQGRLSSRHGPVRYLVPGLRARPVHAGADRGALRPRSRGGPGGAVLAVAIGCRLPRPGGAPPGVRDLGRGRRRRGGGRPGARRGAGVGPGVAVGVLRERADRRRRARPGRPGAALPAPAPAWGRPGRAGRGDLRPGRAHPGSHRSRPARLERAGGSWRARPVPLRWGRLRRRRAPGGASDAAAGTVLLGHVLCCHRCRVADQPGLLRRAVRDEPLPPAAARLHPARDRGGAGARGGDGDRRLDGIGAGDGPHRAAATHARRARGRRGCSA